MKRFAIAVLFGLTLYRPVVAAPSASYVNYGYTTNPPVIDALNFTNYGVFTNFFTSLPFDMSNTTNFYNRGTMSGSVGFRFDTATPFTRRAAAGFFNHGLISGIDTGVSLLGTFNNLSTSIASYVLTDATNIFNDGTLSVGSIGLLRLRGKDVNLSRGALVAGDLVNVNPEAFDTNNIFNTFTLSAGRGLNFGPFGYLNPPGVDDLYWGATAAGTFPLGFLTQVDFFTGTPTPFTPPEPVQLPSSPLNPFNFSFAQLPINTNAIFQASVFTNQFGTNKWVNIVFLNTNFLDTNIVANVRFSPPFIFAFGGTNDFNAMEDIVEFGTPTLDVISQRIVTNAFYLLDSGAISTPITLQTNLGNPNSIARPTCFEITTALPFEWLFSTNANRAYEPELIYPGNYIGAPFDNQYKDFVVDYTSGSYSAQVGRNPESGDGLTSNPTNAFLTNPFLVLADPTNQPARIEVNASRLNVTQSRIRAEGLVSLNCKHLTGGGTAGVDAGIINADLASTNGLLVISNVFPARFKRCRGDIYAWSGTWQNTETNSTGGPLGRGETNAVHFHCLVVDHNLKADFTPTMRNLSLRAPTVIVDDNLRIVRNALFDSENLTFNSSVTLTEQAGSLHSGNTPHLKSFVNDTNGILTVDSEIFLGFDTKDGLASIINRGVIAGVAPLFKADFFENSGAIIGTNGGSIHIQAGTLSLVSTNPASGTNIVTLTNLTCQLLADHDIALLANTLTASNSTVFAGLNGFGQIILDVTDELTDFVPNLPNTNGASVINNFWQTTDGFILFRKPDSGDLFGTQIKSAATNFSEVMHIWAGNDNGADPSAFNNNEVIGHLILERQTTNTLFHFRGPDDNQQYAMYVDNLELNGFSFKSQFTEGLLIDDNLTIYFGAIEGGIDPLDLTNLFNGRLVWVPQFVGPNSTKMVKVFDENGFVQLIPVNRSFAESINIDSDCDGNPNGKDDFPFDGPCGFGAVAFSSARGVSGLPEVRTYVARNGNTANSLTVIVSGKGTVTPKISSGSLVIGHTYELTAVPAPGYVFKDWNGAVVSSNRKISFVLQTNTLLNVSFVPNPFPALKGVYNGLFHETNAVELNSSGFFSLVTTEKGIFTGKLLMGGRSYPFHSQFNIDGYAQTLVKRPGKTSLTMNLQLDVTTNETDQIEGSITDGTWTAVLLGDHSVSKPGKHPALRVGNYTMVLPGNNDAASSPGGDGFGTVSINTSGKLHVEGRLADGSHFNQSVPVSKNGQWPFYVSLYNGKGALLSWVSVDPAGTLGGDVSWIRAAFAGKYYAAGFTSELTLAGARYLAPAIHSTGLSLTNPVVTLSGGNLIGSLTDGVTLNATSLSFTSANDHLTLKLNVKAGSFTGRFINPATSKATSLQGILLQNQNAARGYFLGTNESGAVRLSGDN